MLAGRHAMPCTLQHDCENVHKVVPFLVVVSAYILMICCWSVCVYTQVVVRTGSTILGGLLGFAVMASPQVAGSPLLLCGVLLLATLLFGSLNQHRHRSLILFSLMMLVRMRLPHESGTCAGLHDSHHQGKRSRVAAAANRAPLMRLCTVHHARPLQAARLV